MEQIELPSADAVDMDIAAAIDQRKSVRSFADKSLDATDVGTLLWAAQGITHEQNQIKMRSAPSAGATYPIETFLEVKENGVTDIDAGLYQYDPTKHTLRTEIDNSIRETLVPAASNQPAVAEGQVTIGITADFDRTCSEYPDHGERYVHMEAGHIAQNVHLICEAVGLASCPVGAFNDKKLWKAFDLPETLDPLYLVPVGYPQD